MNPVLRHYFDQDGVESSFRNRGRHYGRPKKVCFGLEPIQQGQPSPQASKLATSRPSVRSASQGSSHPSQRLSRQGSQLSSPQGSTPQPLSPQQRPSPAASHTASRHTSAPPSQPPSRPASLQPSMPQSRAPSKAMSRMASYQPQPSQPDSLPSATPLPSRQSSMQMSRRPSLPTHALHRVPAGSAIGSAEVASVHSQSQRSAPVLPAY
mmetsp:Transcript_104141/g.324714  ORF Transcript_104141/g.324714 Transcript_104141/m.324714 type:complete len:209 (+) Transcript_104141:3-629(+)